MYSGATASARVNTIVRILVMLLVVIGMPTPSEAQEWTMQIGARFSF
jgi:hypothetical protein